MSHTFTRRTRVGPAQIVNRSERLVHRTRRESIKERDAHEHLREQAQGRDYFQRDAAK